MKVDPHAGEPTADLDPATYSAYMEAKANAKSWKAEAERLENMLNEQLGDAYAGLVDGRKLVYHRPEKRFQAARLQKDYPELTQHFLRLEYVNVFDVEAFAKLHPEIAEQYRTRSFRSLADV